MAASTSREEVTVAIALSHAEQAADFLGVNLTTQAARDYMEELVANARLFAGESRHLLYDEEFSLVREWSTNGAAGGVPNRLLMELAMRGYEVAYRLCDGGETCRDKLAIIGLGPDALREWRGLDRWIAYSFARLVCLFLVEEGVA